MGSFKIFIIAIGLAMDAFAVSVANGAVIKEVKLWQAIVFGLYFGIFQCCMAILGYTAGKFFADSLSQWGGWIAFFLLITIGCNMIIDAVRKHNNSEVVCKSVEDIMKWQNMTMLGIATSIDALVVGVGFAVISLQIFGAALIIGLCALIMSVLGVLLGNRMNKYLKNCAEVVGGIMLIAIAIKILIENI